MADDEITFAVKGLQPTGKISPQPWMTAPETRTIVDALTAGEADVRFVGGCVRDGLAHRPLVEDLDIATPEPPDVVMGRLEDAGIKGPADRHRARNRDRDHRRTAIRGHLA